MYSNVKFMTLTVVLGFLVFAGLACSNAEMNRFVSPERDSAISIGKGDVVSEDAKVAAIETMRIQDKVLSSEISVKFVDGITDSQREKILKKYNLSVMKVIEELGFYRLKMKDGSALTGELSNLWDEELVKVAEPIYRTYAKQLRVEPNDPRFSEQAYLEHINAPEAWFVEPGSDLGSIPAQSDVLVAVLDTGLDLDHPDIMVNVGAFDDVKILTGWNFVDGNGDVSDGHGHGTLVTGIIGALTSNGQGIAGTAWNPRILPVKILDNNGMSDSFLSAEGIMFALARFKDVSG
ncbi:S8 family serine peptidase, partial [bacterium]|nr:S8 family serine peptidase [bacterium]